MERLHLPAGSPQPSSLLGAPGISGGTARHWTVPVPTSLLMLRPPVPTSLPVLRPAPSVPGWGGQGQHTGANAFTTLASAG